MPVPTHLGDLVPDGWILGEGPAFEILTTAARLFQVAPDGTQPALGTWIMDIVKTTADLFNVDGAIEDWYPYAVMWISATGTLLRTISLGWLSDVHPVGFANTMTLDPPGAPVQPRGEEPAGEPAGEEEEPEEPESLGTTTTVISTGSATGIDLTIPLLLLLAEAARE